MKQMIYKLNGNRRVELVAGQIRTVKTMLSNILVDMAIEAFKKGIKATLVPASCNYNHIDTLEMITKQDDKFDYADVCANDIESFEKGISFISKYSSKPEPIKVNTDEDPLGFSLQDEDIEFMVSASREEEPLDKDSMY